MGPVAYTWTNVSLIQTYLSCKGASSSVQLRGAYTPCFLSGYTIYWRSHFLRGERNPYISDFVVWAILERPCLVALHMRLQHIILMLVHWHLPDLMVQAQAAFFKAREDQYCVLYKWYHHNEGLWPHIKAHLPSSSQVSDALPQTKFGTVNMPQSDWLLCNAEIGALEQRIAHRLSWMTIFMRQMYQCLEQACRL